MRLDQRSGGIYAMTVILYGLNILFAVAQSALGKTIVYGTDGKTFNFCKVFAAFLIFAVTVPFLGFHSCFFTLCCGSLHGVFLYLATVYGLKALHQGPMALTSMAVSFSLLIPVSYGILILKEPAALTTAAGLFLLFPTLVLINGRSKNTGGGLNRQWLLFTAITLLANGFGSVVQKMHQTEAAGAQQREFMLFSTFAALLLLLVFEVFAGRAGNFTSGKSVWCKGAAAGCLNGISNFIVLFLASAVKAAVLFPMLSVLTICASLAAGWLLFRERLNRWQLLGFCTGLCALFLLNL